VGQFIFSGNESSSVFVGLLPFIAVEWVASDLSLFTPASAPILPTSRLAQYESSLVARPRSGVAASTSTEPSKPTSKTSPQQTRAAQTGTQSNTDLSRQSHGLSTGAKAGIGVGVSIAVLFLFAIGFWILRRRRKPKREENGRPFVDAKSELPDNSMAHGTVAELPDRDREELPADSERLEAADNQRLAEVAAEHERLELAANSRPQELPSHDLG
jgi:hypothetical protein